MKALILNSGSGSRMGCISDRIPKCMTPISKSDTILSRQLKLLVSAGVTEIVITTGPFRTELIDYCNSLELPVRFHAVQNSNYRDTNYIYSIYCAREYLNDDVLLMHGDLVFEESVLESVLSSDESCMVVSRTAEAQDKDFKADIFNNRIITISTRLTKDAVSAQPLYKLNADIMKVWLDSIIEFCNRGETNCYAEEAFNKVLDRCNLVPCDVRRSLCGEIDTQEDLIIMREKLKELSSRKVYMCFSSDIIHTGHIKIIREAQKLGGLMIGVLSDEAVASYKRYPLVTFDERKALLENIKDVQSVVKQDTLSYKNILEELKPDIVVHGDDWRTGFQKPVRDEVLSVLAEYGGQLKEFPYSHDEKYDELERNARDNLTMPDVRRGRLRKLLAMKKTLSIIEAHSGLTGLIAETTKVFQQGKTYQFDGIWISSLCDSTAKGKPDIELIDMTSRLSTIHDIMEVTTKPIILDGDTGGQTEHFVYNVRTLERMGVSAIIIEDKIGLKKNSLFGTEVDQVQDSMENFALKISAGKKAQRSNDFMIIARIESLILEQGMEDALRRAFTYVAAGADGIMIHSRKKDPAEIFEFSDTFRSKDRNTPIIVVPTSFHEVTEDEFMSHGINIVIYANQLIRSGFPAMQKTAITILINRRAKEADEMCMSIKEILTLIPEA